MTAEIVFMPGTRGCEVCSRAVGNLLLEGLLVCADCAQALAKPPAPSWEPLEKPRGPSLAEIVDTLVRSAR